MFALPPFITPLTRAQLVSGDLATKMAPGTPLSPSSMPSTPTVSTLSTTTKLAAAKSSIVAAAEKRTAERHASSGPRGAKGKGMALGSAKGKGGMSNGQAALMAELEKEMKSEEVEVADAWDDDDQATPAEVDEAGGDLMDVNADEDDWTAFESAPTGSAPPADTAAAAWGAALQSPASITVSENPWQESADDLASAFNAQPTYPSLSTSSTLQPKTTSSRLGSSGKSTPSMSAVPSTWQSPITSPKVANADADDWGNVVAVEDVRSAAASPPPASASMAGMSKEEKAAEMARRREERKARIAQLKEQKKGGA
ncbi:hypothetical protein M408DRAFT_196263 [Serendipita vermifera MAFF 305830]|uniref:Uncharacterized protein n=1 Tax=Serendipita vermifera MAFF 305830 TaxID=933852 RepID=A0A0C3AK20_SERVB|nr:hypothetical protein M408DRAFT_196263 [Serendipita vermifera MAFF 305830]